MCGTWVGVRRGEETGTEEEGGGYGRRNGGVDVRGGESDLNV